jgi:thiosulfate reductase cytochrome b subunit
MSPSSTDGDQPPAGNSPARPGDAEGAGSAGDGHATPSAAPEAASVPPEIQPPVASAATTSAAPGVHAPSATPDPSAPAATPSAPAAAPSAPAAAPASAAGDRAFAGAAAASTAAGPGTLAGRRPLVHRHHWLVRLTHWANAILLVGMIGSGLQIYGAFPFLGQRGGPLYPNPWNGKPFPPWARLGGWLAGGLNWHFALAWPFVLTGAAYLLYLAFSGEWRSLLFRPRDVPRAVAMQLYYLRLRKDHPPQGKHNALQKAAYTFIVLLGVISVLSGFAIYKPAQLSWLTALFGGYELARFWHFWAVFLFLAFTLAHVTLVFLVDPASLRAMITGWYRGRFPSHD